MNNLKKDLEYATFLYSYMLSINVPVNKKDYEAYKLITKMGDKINGKNKVK